MRKDTIGQSTRTTVKISDSLQSSVLHSIRNVVSDELVEQTCREVGYHFRKRKLTPVVTVLHMILSALWPEESFNACWQVLWDTFVSWFPQFQGKSPSRRRVAGARARLPLTLWRGLFEAISQQAQQRSAKYDTWKGHRVALADGTCVSMTHTPELVQAFGVNQGHHGRGRYPLARLVTVCLAKTRTILDYAMGGYRQGEWSLLSSIVGSLKKGDLLIGDRHFAGVPYYVCYQNHGLEFLTRAHHRFKIARVKRILRYRSEDFLGRLNLGKLHRRKGPSLPRTSTCGSSGRRCGSEADARAFGSSRLCGTRSAIRPTRSSNCTRGAGGSRRCCENSRSPCRPTCCAVRLPTESARNSSPA